jgi:site-specific recombinase XerD
VFLADGAPERLLAATTTARDRVLLMTGLYCGLRCSEICKLLIEDVDLKRGAVMVRLGKGSKDRIVPIPDRFKGILRGWIGGRQSGHVFPSPRGGRLTNRAIQKLIKRVAKRAGLRDFDRPRAVTPHKLRHAYASRLIQAGADIIAVRDLLGHSSVSTTQVYTHTDPDRLKATVNKLFEGE